MTNLINTIIEIEGMASILENQETLKYLRGEMSNYDALKKMYQGASFYQLIPTYEVEEKLKVACELDGLKVCEDTIIKALVRIYNSIIVKAHAVKDIVELEYLLNKIEGNLYPENCTEKDYCEVCAPMFYKWDLDKLWEYRDELMEDYLKAIKLK